MIRFGLGLTLAAAWLALAPAAMAVGNSTTYPQDVDLVLAGPPAVTLQILTGSVSNTLDITAADFTFTLLTGTFKVRYPGPNPKQLTDGTTIYCNNVGGNNDVTFTVADSGKTISIDATDCSATSGGGGGGGGTASTTPFLTFSAPNGGQTLNAGSSYLIFWSAGGSGVIGVKLSLSHDSGLTYPDVIVNGIANTSYYSWTVPDLNTDKARIKIDLLGSGGTLLSDSSDSDFTIIGSSITPPTTVVPPTTETTPGTTAETPTTETTTTTPVAAETPTTASGAAVAEASAPASDANTSGGYAPEVATEATPTINVDKQLEPPPPEKPALCASGTLIKGSGKAVYFCGKDGKRYVFPNQATFLSWYKDFSSVKTIGDAILAQIRLGGNVTYKPGVRMVKIQTDPKVYAIARGGLLRWVKNEAAAKLLYGDDWNRKIDDVADAFFINYRIGPPIEEAEALSGIQ